METTNDNIAQAGAKTILVAAIAALPAWTWGLSSQLVRRFWPGFAGA